MNLFNFFNFFSHAHHKRRQADAPLYAISSGRSMVEMLGVLAIIGVLSVGAIAGYSKAMEKYKLNQYAHNYNLFFNEMINYRDSLISHDTVNQTSLTETLSKLNFAADFEYTHEHFYDNLNGHFAVYTRNSRLTVDYYLGADQGRDLSNSKICEYMVSNVLKPLHETILSVGTYRGDQTFGSSLIYGDANCKPGTLCLKDVRIGQIKDFCSQCIEDKLCLIAISF